MEECDKLRDTKFNGRYAGLRTFMWDNTNIDMKSTASDTKIQPINISDITTKMLVKAVSFCDGLGSTIFGWKRCRIRNDFSVAAFWNNRRIFWGMYLPLWMYWIRDIMRHVRPMQAWNQRISSHNFFLVIGNLIQKRLCCRLLLRHIVLGKMVCQEMQDFGISLPWSWPRSRSRIFCWCLVSLVFTGKL